LGSFLLLLLLLFFFFFFDCLLKTQFIRRAHTCRL
jgi:hypothetical protein